MSEINQFLEDKKKDGANGKITHIIHEKSNLNRGAYCLTNSETLVLYKLINNELEKGNKVSLVERFNNVSTLMIDLDFKYIDKFSDRQYTENYLKELYSFLCDKINEIFSLEDPNQLQVFVLEKDNIVNAPQKGYESKDGIHLIFPGIVQSVDKYKLLMDKIIESSDEYDQIVDNTIVQCGLTKSSNDIKGIFDKSIYSGNWFIYGCGKINDPFTYKLTHIYRLTDDDNIVESPIDIYLDNPLDLMKINSVQLHTESTVEYIGDEILKNKPSNNNVNMSSDSDPYDLNIVNEIKLKKEDISLIEKLVDILSVDRATDHTEWMEVGYCLHSLSKKFCNLFEKFSLKYDRYAKRLSKRDCAKQWTYMNNTAQKNYTMGSLKYWARKDNEEAYEKIRKESLESLIIKSIKKDKSCGAHSDMANVIFKYYTDDFVCAGLRENSWYYFDQTNGKWRLTEQGHELRKRLSCDIIEIYEHYAMRFKRLRGDDQEEEDYEKYDKYVMNCYSVILKLKDSNYKDKIMKECKEKFYDPEFMDKLNANLQLLGLDNCVVDLRYEKINSQGEKTNIIQFREGRPDDYISLSTGYDLPFDIKLLPLSLDKVNELLPRALDNYDILHNDLEDVIRKILPHEEINDYTFRFLSSCLSGEVREEKFYFWTGSGSNGKSKIVELIEHAMGDYSKLMDVSYITNKRGSSAAASPELERIRYARFVWMSEPDKDDQVFVGKLKQITGGDKMSSRGLFKEASDFKPQFKIILMCNDLPKLANIDGGVIRRIEVVDFPSKFVANPRPTANNPHQYKMDLQLGEKLKQWNLLFLVKLLGYYRLYDTEGTKAPESVTKATEVYLTENDIIRKWIEKDLVECEEVKLFNNIYDSFIIWCENEGINHKKYPKGDIKKELEKMQEKTEYGLSYGKRVKDGQPNGTPNAPKFNYCSVEDMDDD